jgi:hypothetical protein
MERIVRYCARREFRYERIKVFKDVFMEIVKMMRGRGMGCGCWE